MFLLHERIRIRRIRHWIHALLLKDIIQSEILAKTVLGKPQKSSYVGGQSTKRRGGGIGLNWMSTKNQNFFAASL